MQKRTILLGDFNTAEQGWTLSGWSLSDPAQKTTYVEKKSGDGSWDLSTVMTDGVPIYKDRTFTAVLERSDGTRAERETFVNTLVNQFDGMACNYIVPPDRPDYYLDGRLKVAVNYSDLAHAAVTITGTCRPWLYRLEETKVIVEPSSKEQTLYLTNNGRKVVIPQITVWGPLTLKYGDKTLSLSTDGEFIWPELVLPPGSHELKYSGDGSVQFAYREAVLR